jgi:hypothetical protein
MVFLLDDSAVSLKDLGYTGHELFRYGIKHGRRQAAKHIQRDVKLITQVGLQGV